MEEELIDRFKQYPEGKGNQTITMFIISISLLIFAIVAYSVMDSFRVPDWLQLFPTMCGIASFGISIGGIVVGFSEMKYSTRWVRTGLVGHFVIISIPILFVVYHIIFLFIYVFDR